AQLICEEIARHAPQVQCLQAEDEAAAVELALRDLAPGRLVVLFYERWATVADVLARHGAEPASRIPLLHEPAQASARALA
ncbi:MAG: hypothetical protein MUC68_16630, partial [Burkholderiaceae bacterium]|nr:hypothetical protein [Burkholderiaceae bacterium]